MTDKMNKWKKHIICPEVVHEAAYAGDYQTLYDYFHHGETLYHVTPDIARDGPMLLAEALAGYRKDSFAATYTKQPEMGKEAKEEALKQDIAAAEKLLATKKDVSKKSVHTFLDGYVEPARYIAHPATPELRTERLLDIASMLVDAGLDVRITRGEVARALGEPAALMNDIRYDVRKDCPELNVFLKDAVREGRVARAAEKKLS